LKALSNETRFELKMGQHLERAQAPAIAHRGFMVVAKFNAEGPDGVIVAQGGTSRGYTLFLKDGRLTFLVRTSSDIATSIATPETITGSHTALAQFESDGKLTLKLDEQTVGSTKAPGLISAMPVDGLEVGSDAAGQVGPYASDNKFQGSINSVVVELN